MKDFLRLGTRVDSGEKVPPHEVALAAIIDAAVITAILSALYWVATVIGGDYAIGLSAFAGILFILVSSGLFIGVSAVANRAPRKLAVENGEDFDHSSADFTTGEAVLMIAGAVLSKTSQWVAFGYIVVGYFV